MVPTINDRLILILFLFSYKWLDYNQKKKMYLKSKISLTFITKNYSTPAIEHDKWIFKLSILRTD